ncbi:RNA polymerase subunit sigma-70 [bacterium]|nr:RNA polymerase subunit sigma-70 [bacterium]
MVHSLIDRSAREAYGRLVALLTARTRDVEAAEDALQEAFLAALEQWPLVGVPRQPEAWLMAVARRRWLDRTRKESRMDRYSDFEAHFDAMESETSRGMDLPDDRLELMMICAHPVLESSLHAPLILQTVLGMTADQVASVFLTSPAGMAQRLVRAKRKIKLAGLRFELPGHEQLEARLGALLDAVYAAFGAAWDDWTGADGQRRLATEAEMLCAAMAGRLPEHPEVLGLWALMKYHEARYAARRAADGSFVPLDEQDVSRWNAGMIEEAETLVRRAAAALKSSGRLGRYALEAAIQSAHVTNRLNGSRDSAGIYRLYEALVRVAPSRGVRVAHAAAAAEAVGAETGLRLLEAVGDGGERPYQPFYALRAELLYRLGRYPEAQLDYDRAIALSTDEAVRGYLRGRKKR